MLKEENNDQYSSLALSKGDIDRLLTEETPDVRIEIAKKISYNHTSRKYSLHELSLAEQIMRVLVKDAEVSVRETLADVLKSNPHAPKDIIMSLARDNDTVALPIIEYSTVLSDEDLILLIKTVGQISKKIVIANRNPVSKKVSAKLVETKEPQVVSQLAKNSHADIADDTYMEIISDHASNKEILNTVAKRPNLPVTIVEKIITLVSDTIAEELRSKYNVDFVAVTVETEKTREIATLKLVDGKLDGQDVEKLVDQLRVFGRLTPSMILTSLCRGNLYFFETSLARLSNIPVRNAQLLIHDKGGMGFKALYAKADLPDKFFAACKLLLEVVSEMKKEGQAKASRQYANTVVQKLLSKSSGKNIDNLSYIIALIRQTSF